MANDLTSILNPVAQAAAATPQSEPATRLAFRGNGYAGYEPVKEGAPVAKPAQGRSDNCRFRPAGC